MVTSFIVLLLFVFLAIILYPSLFGTKEVTIPDLKGKALDEAITELVNEGLVVGKTIKIEDDTIPVDAVIKTNPKAGKEVKEGASVNIYQSIGKNKINLSDYVGQKLTDVEPLLEEMNFKDIVVTEEFSDEVDSGLIISQIPAANSEVSAEETVIEFKVSKGSDQISLKDLSGYSEAGLKDYAAENGLKIEVEKEEYHNTIPEGQVYKQSPSAFSKVDKGTTVKVVLSKGKEAIPPKTIEKEIVIEYEPLEPGVAQYIKIYIEDLNNNINQPVEQFYMTETKKRNARIKNSRRSNS